MRLIDADALERESIPLDTHGGARFIALGSLRCAPTVDAVPVIRCLECKYRRPVVDAHTCEETGLWCYICGDERKDDDFCSYGKRRG